MNDNNNEWGFQDWSMNAVIGSCHWAPTRQKVAVKGHVFQRLWRTKLQHDWADIDPQLKRWPLSNGRHSPPVSSSCLIDPLRSSFAILSRQ